jgi:hypothetical protein
MDKSAASRLMPGSPVMFRGRRHFVVSALRGPQSDAPLFRMRDLDDAWVVTGLVSYKMLEPVPEESAVKIEEPGLDDFEGGGVKHRVDEDDYPCTRIRGSRHPDDSDLQNELRASPRVRAPADK